ncbi:MAG TPA: patatin-like phospholipase family protein [Mycobacteriales bacterium]|nr:patatin-like phospholipase family protein [Mycobacteriales bacterium]
MKGRALVLGGGGVAGIGWETGVLFGLAEGGVDVTAADVVIGTSAGSAVGAQLLSGTPLAELYDRHVFPEGPSTEIAAELDVEKMVADWSALLANHEPGPDLRAAIGRYALAAGTVPERARRGVIGARLPSHDWPVSPLQIVAVDASTGEERIFTADDGVPLVDAVAASCAVPGIWPPVTIGDRRYVDGGVRTSANVDLAEGHGVVLVLAPVNDLTAPEPAIAKRLEKVEKKSTVFTIRPDEASVAAIGANPLDPSAAGPAARAGREQGAALVAEVSEIWAQ